MRRGLPDVQVVVIAGCHELSRVAQLAEASHSLSVEAAKLNERVLQRGLFLRLLSLVFVVLFSEGLGGDLELAEHARLRATDQDLERPRVVQIADVVVQVLRLADRLAEGPLLLDLVFEDLQ